MIVEFIINRALSPIGFTGLGIYMITEGYVVVSIFSFFVALFHTVLAIKYPSVGVDE